MVLLKPTNATAPWNNVLGEGMARAAGADSRLHVPTEAAAEVVRGWRWRERELRGENPGSLDDDDDEEIAC